MIAEGHEGHHHDETHPHSHEHAGARPAAARPSGQDTAAAHLLLVSIGNTRITVASWTESRRAAARSFTVGAAEEALGEMQGIWESFPAGDKRAVVITSVNPPKLDEIRRGCGQQRMQPVLVVGEDLDPPMPADLPEPAKVGTDRLCTAAAAYARMKAACVVADLGTAATIDLISDDGVFLGGTILPGMGLCARALHEHTALLPLVEVGRPTETLGKDTASAIRNGIFAMMVGALREVTERYATDIGKWPPLIVTGGDAEAVAGACDFVDRIAPDLVLDGLVIAWQNAFEPPES